MTLSVALALVVTLCTLVDVVFLVKSVRILRNCERQGFVELARRVRRHVAQGLALVVATMIIAAANWALVFGWWR